MVQYSGLFTDNRVYDAVLTASRLTHAPATRITGTPPSVIGTSSQGEPSVNTPSKLTAIGVMQLISGIINFAVAWWLWEVTIATLPTAATTTRNATPYAALELVRPLRAGCLYTRDPACTAHGLFVFLIP